MLKCDFNKGHGCSPVNLLHIFRTFFPKNTYGGLRLERFHIIINPFQATVSFIYTPWKHQKTSGFTNVFRGYRSRILARNGLNYSLTRHSCHFGNAFRSIIIIFNYRNSSVNLRFVLFGILSVWFSNYSNFI